MACWEVVYPTCVSNRALFTGCWLPVANNMHMQLDTLMGLQFMAEDALPFLCKRESLASSHCGGTPIPQMFKIA